MLSNPNKPFLIVFYTFLVLLLLSLVVSKNTWKTLGLNELNLVADLQKKATPKHRSTYSPQKHKPLKNLVKDTILANAAVTRLIRNDVAIEVRDTTGEHVGLNLFLRALHKQAQQKNKKVRIGYFGDSMIEGDLITQTIRSILQNKFGGSGVGYIPITSVVAQFRQTVKAVANTNWEDVNYNNNKEKRIIGFSGHTFFANQNATVELKPGGGKNLSSLYQLSLLYGPSEESTSLTFNNEPVKIEGSRYFNLARLNSDSNLKSAKLVFNQSKTPLYGLSAESKYGVVLDNLSFRGTSGTELTRLNSKMLQQLDSLRHYDLIVLHYGPNLLYNDSIKNFSYYFKQMEKSIKHLKKVFPQTSILIVSTADKAFKIDGEFRTGDGVEALLLVQQKLAQKYHCAFYNLYEAMGGYNSMKTWAEKKPILAGSDYTHFNQSGSAKIGRLIGNALLNEYEKTYPAN